MHDDILHAHESVMIYVAYADINVRNKNISFFHFRLENFDIYRSKNLNISLTR